MDAKQVMQQELELSRHELKGIESEIARLTEARFDKLLHIARVRTDLTRLECNIPVPSAALLQFETDRENGAL